MLIFATKMIIVHKAYQRLAVNFVQRICDPLSFFIVIEYALLAVVE